MLWICSSKVFVVSVYIFKTRLLLESTQVKVLILQLFNLISQVTRAAWQGTNLMHCCGPSRCRTPTVPFPLWLLPSQGVKQCFLLLESVWRVCDPGISREAAGSPLSHTCQQTLVEVDTREQGLAFEQFLPKLCFLFSKSEEVGAFVLFCLCEHFTVHASLALTCFLRAIVYALCLV